MGDVSSPNEAYKRMQKKWKLVDALLELTEGMRAAGETFLPREPAETEEAYEVRLGRSFLHGYYSGSVDTNSSLPFAEPVTINGTLNKAVEPILDNADYEGRNLTQVARDIFEDGVAYGKSHILVDYPDVGEGLWWNDYGRARAGIFPYFVHVRAKELIGWEQDNEYTKEKEILAEIRILRKTSRKKTDDPYEEEYVEETRVYTKNEVILYEKGPDDDEPTERWRRPFALGYIPFFTFYTKRVGFLEAVPPMYDLAETELTYWQSYSDHRNILRFSRFGLLFASGFTKAEIEKKMIIGPNRLIASTNKDAKLGHVQADCEPIEAGERDLRELERRMQAQGSQPLILKPVTATERKVDDKQMKADIHYWIEDCANTILNGIKACHDWVKKPMADDVAVQIYNEFEVGGYTDADTKILTDLYVEGKLPPIIYFEEMIHRGKISDNRTPEEIVDLLENDDLIGRNNPINFKGGLELEGGEDDQVKPPKEIEREGKNALRGKKGQAG